MNQASAHTALTSQLSIDYQRCFVTTAQFWARGFTQSIGAPDGLDFTLALLLEECLLFVIDKYPDKTGEADLQIRLQVLEASRLYVEIEDLGPPLSTTVIEASQPTGSTEGTELWLRLVRGYAPNLTFTGRGSSGWLISFSLAMPDWQPPLSAHPVPAELETQRRDLGDQVRLQAITPAEIPGITQLVYATYRYSYQHPEIYDLAAYTQKLISGSYDAVAAVLNDAIVGMAAFKFDGNYEHGAEAGALMVHPDYRGTGVRQKLEAFYEQGYEQNSRDKDFFFGYQVTQHDRSQRSQSQSERFIFSPLGFFLNKNPPIRFVGMQRGDDHREAAIEVFMAVKPLTLSTVFLADTSHEQIVGRLLQQVSSAPALLPAAGEPTGLTQLKQYVHRPGRYASIEIIRWGEDWSSAISRACIDCLAEGSLAVRLLLTSDPELPADAHAFLSALGAGFCGIALINAGVLAHSYVLTKQPVNFRGIQVFREDAKSLLAFIEAHWPGPAVAPPQPDH
ncbi:MAG: GNAT family N-acetyltransferase [Cellvibrionales bacterium]|jgi:GNAT superfamily N-acetyltransferase